MRDEQGTRDTEEKPALAPSAQELDSTLQLFRLCLYRLQEQYYQHTEQHPYPFSLERLGYRQQKLHWKRLGGVSHYDSRQQTASTPSPTEQ